MPTQLAELARLVDGQLLGDGSLEITGAATLATAAEGDISLLDCAERVKDLDATQAAAVVVSPGIDLHGRPGVVVEDVHTAFARIVCHFRPPRQRPPVGISPQARIDPSARPGAEVNVYPGANIGPDVQIGDRVTIHSGVTIMAGCRIGEGVVIFPNVVLYEDTIVGDRTIIHAGAVLGAYGFGYESGSGQHILSAQLGYVEIGPDVEIGAGTTIDRGTYGPTTVGAGTKIDDQVMIAHNCRIGRHNLICSQVGIAGSSTTGDYVVMAGQVGIRDHVHIGDGAVLGAMAGVMNDIPAGSTYVGVPATPMREQIVKQAALGRLPEMRRQLHAMQRTLLNLTQDRNEGDQAAA
ncbi:MAG: UDP-3-O-(3-hydroxymyristoyl)glucosamine N-acyltransferase [Planctomycetales bacterium]|nr:UDP-3-O-(3-hydroxymyristoyl)glucosamine N-acyltransferase [Planctomycetales bacterium]NIO33601.1 UDP-3-O-(3-hydroxymyristoyl)glucosamine N-acyltransferase [Planctomycetales bacterium]NIO45938.1 UDP-3-O-(3-hydroxymyristoyl)glucosamine N-acyltransferase [Planctomycetales bacterium]NIP67937.1 UDP-3-O-(3-hydroxymyristoyl)glucosamine N-acyltransferase [Planctomycetales bacterium]